MNPKQQGPSKQNPQPDRPADPKPDEPIAKQNANEGEGNRTAARKYDNEATRFANSGKVEGKAREAERAFDGPEGPSLRDAEAEGKARGTGKDPARKAG
jgi:hypothetical protein